MLVVIVRKEWKLNAIDIKILDMNEDVNIKVDSDCFELLKQIELENWK